ncbi:MAG: M20/M25/M40 family metallo-hydrolase [Candidatus Aenigmarchaeota archaeon]|nr:M20/M25/M40 family metallo-hydrolase [Candidatus Aenigmarchaeota archaeon]
MNTVSDWDCYFDRILENAVEIGEDITYRVRDSDYDALQTYAEARKIRQDAVENMLKERDADYITELFIDTICGESKNIIATLSGDSAKIVYITAHSDYAAGTGAEDNGSGIAVALAAYDCLKNEDIPFTLKIAIFDNEEVFSIGSQYYVNARSEEEKENILGVINLDCVGSGKDLVLPKATLNVVDLGKSITYADPDLHKCLVESAEDLGYTPITASFDTFYTDHDAFCRAGIPAATISTAEILSDSNYNPEFTSPVHSPNDIRSALKDEYLNRTLAVVLKTVEKIKIW